jgi:hypothetical protein
MKIGDMIDLAWKMVISLMLGSTLCLAGTAYRHSITTAREVATLQEQMTSFIPRAYSLNFCRNCHKGFTYPPVNLAKELLND